MERDEFVKRAFKAYQEIEYKDHGMDQPAVCLLSGIDWDAELMTLLPIHEGGFEPKEFQANITFCSIPRKKMKVVK